MDSVPMWYLVACVSVWVTLIVPIVATIRLFRAPGDNRRLAYAGAAVLLWLCLYFAVDSCNGRRAARRSTRSDMETCIPKRPGDTGEDSRATNAPEDRRR